MEYETSVMTSKGQLVVPARLRRRYGMKKGTLVAFVDDGRRLIVQPVTRDFIHSLRGSLARKPSPLEALLCERKRERTL